MEALDWAFAGVSSSEVREDGRGGRVTHSTWHHWVDSHTAEPDGIRDEGDMMRLPAGRTLETGRMVNPATGKEMDYEELWRDLEPETAAVTPGGRRAGPMCVVLHLDGGEEGRGKTGGERRGMVIRLGRICQGIVTAGDGGVAAERWVWSEDGGKGWEMVRRLGRGRVPGLPCEAVVDETTAMGLLVGGEVRLADGQGDDGVWRVLEVGW